MALMILWSTAFTGPDDDFGPLAVIFLGMLALLLVGAGGVLGLVLGSVFGTMQPGRTRRIFWLAMATGSGASGVTAFLSAAGWWTYMTHCFNFKTEGLMGPLLGWIINAVAVMALGAVAAIWRDRALRTSSLSQG